MAHLICLKFPFLCIMVFSVTVRHCTPESEPVDIASDMYEDAARLVEATITEIDREKEIEQAEHLHKHVHPTIVNPLLEHSHDQKCERTANHHRPEHQHEGPSEFSFRNSVLVAMRHLSSSLIGFLPKYLQDTILDANGSLIFTGIIALSLVSICVPCYFIELFLSVRPLKKKVTDLNKTLWMVSTAFENQQEEYDVYKDKALAYDEDKNKLEQLETELHLVKQIEVKLKTENRTLKKRINTDVKVAERLEALITKTMNERDQVKDERDKFKSATGTFQLKLKETAEQLTTAQTDVHTKEMDLKLLMHTNENLKKEIEESKAKLITEIELRRELQSEIDSISIEKNAVAEELLDLKSVLHKYEETVNSLNDEISVKENEFLALKEVLGEDSPLVDITEATAKLKVAEGQTSSLQARIESLTLENSSLTRDYERAKKTLDTLQMEKDQAETRLQVLEAYFKEKEEEFKRMIEKYEAEKEIRGKDKAELVQFIEEKNDSIRDLTERLEKLKQEFEETRLAHRNEVRALETKGHETWLSLCQSERKAQDGRNEAELLRQRLTASAKAKETDGRDALSLNGEVPYSFSQLDLDEIPLPLPDEPTLPSYFGLGDFEPPLPLDDEEDDDDDEVLGLQTHRRHTVSTHEQQRPPPLGQMSPHYSDHDDERDLSPIRGLGGRTEYSDGSSSPPSPPQGHAEDSGESRENSMNGSLHTSRRRQPLNASSPYEHGVNL